MSLYKAEKKENNIINILAHFMLSSFVFYCFYHFDYFKFRKYIWSKINDLIND